MSHCIECIVSMTQKNRKHQYTYYVQPSMCNAGIQFDVYRKKRLCAPTKCQVTCARIKCRCTRAHEYRRHATMCGQSCAVVRRLFPRHALLSYQPRYTRATAMFEYHRTASCACILSTYKTMLRCRHVVQHIFRW